MGGKPTFDNILGFILNDLCESPKNIFSFGPALCPGECSVEVTNYYACQEIFLILEENIWEGNPLLIISLDLF